MRNFLNIANGIDVTPALLQLHAHPELWDANRLRTAREGSPHDASDIWVRYRPLGDGFDQPGPIVWYPAAVALPALRPIVSG